jgi:hypothetical protein
MTEMKLSMVAVATVLFVCLSPGILFKIPIKASPLIKVLLHGVIFGTVLYILVEASLRVNLFENFESSPVCGKGAVLYSGAGNCVNSATKKLSTPVCKVGTEFNSATNMCVNISDKGNHAQGKSAHGMPAQGGSAKGMPAKGMPAKGVPAKGVTTRAATTKVVAAPASKSKSSNKRK